MESRDRPSCWLRQADDPEEKVSYQQVMMDPRRIVPYEFDHDEAKVQSLVNDMSGGYSFDHKDIPPLLAVGTESGGNLIDGHHRLIAAQTLGLQQVPVLLIEQSVYDSRVSQADAEVASGDLILIETRLLRSADATLMEEMSQAQYGKSVDQLTAQELTTLRQALADPQKPELYVVAHDGKGWLKRSNTVLAKEVGVPRFVVKLFPDLKPGRWVELNLEKELENVDVDISDPVDFQKRVDQLLVDKKADYIYGGFLEDRTQMNSSYEGEDDRPVHLGNDVWVPAETKVSLLEDGEVVHIMKDMDTESGWGGRVMFRLKNGYYLIYGHLDHNLSVKVGDVLKAGDIVGKLGEPPYNGNFPPHLHVQIMSKAFVKEFENDLDSIDGYLEVNNPLLNEVLGVEALNAVQTTVSTISFSEPYMVAQGYAQKEPLRSEGDDPEYQHLTGMWGWIDPRGQAHRLEEGGSHEQWAFDNRGIGPGQLLGIGWIVLSEAAGVLTMAGHEPSDQQWTALEQLVRERQYQSVAFDLGGRMGQISPEQLRDLPLRQLVERGPAGSGAAAGLADKWLKQAKKHSPAYEKETEKINKNKEKPKAKQVHKFKPAEWTHPNGHPRCLICGQSERIGGKCNKEPTAADHAEFKAELEFGDADKVGWLRSRE